MWLLPNKIDYKLIHKRIRKILQVIASVHIKTNKQTKIHQTLYEVKKDFWTLKLLWAGSRLRRLLICENWTVLAEKNVWEGKTKIPKGRAKNHRKSFSESRIGPNCKIVTYAQVDFRISMDRWFPIFLLYLMEIVIAVILFLSHHCMLAMYGIGNLSC